MNKASNRKNRKGKRKPAPKDKTLLGEAKTIRMMGLAGLEPIASDFVGRLHERGSLDEMGFGKDPLREMPDDEELDMDDEGGEEMPPADDMGGEEMPPDDMGDEGEAGGNEALVADIVDAIASALTDVTGVEVDVEGGAGGELGGDDMGGDLGGDDLGGDDMGDMDDMGGEEEDEEMPLGESAENPFAGTADHKLKKGKEETPKTVETEPSRGNQDPAGRGEGGAGGRTSGTEGHNAGSGKLPKPLGLGEGQVDEEDESLEEVDRESLVNEIARRVKARLMKEVRRRKEAKASQNRTRGLPKRKPTNRKPRRK
jgi:hypothetical protein